MTRPPRRPRRSHVRYQQGRHQHRNRPHTRTNPGRQYGPHPRHAAGSIGVKFCAAPAMLLAPREVCASAVKTADPANSNAIARVSVTLRISSLLGLSGCAHLAVPRPPFYRPRLFRSLLNIGDSSSLSSISAAVLSLRMSRESLTTHLQFALGAKSSDAKSGERNGRRRYDALSTQAEAPISQPVRSYASWKLGRAKERSPGRGRSGALVQRRHHDSG